MEKTFENFITAVNKIPTNGFSMANEVLYDISKEDHYMWGIPANLSGKMLLIGRAYAASPERSRKYKVENPGDGTGDFFEKVSTNFLENEEYKNLLSLLKDNELPFKYDASAYDIQKLGKTVSLVLLFNDILLNACAIYDQKEISDYKNQVSFCSKFLHFHSPNSVFILDSYVLNGGKHLLSTATKNNFQFSNCEINKDFRNTCQEILIKRGIQYKGFDDKIQKTMSKEFVDKLTSHTKDYLTHCVNAYLLGVLLKSSDNLKPTITPRLIDRILQQIKPLTNE